MSINRLYELYQKKEPIACLTAYDASFATLMNEAEIDLVLVGDSLGTVIQGKQDTISVTMRDILYHSACVRETLNTPVMMSDMPFLSYSNPKKALENAGKLFRLGVDMVKLEGDQSIAPMVKILVDNYIPVCAHIGLKPQQARQMGGYYIHGKNEDSKQQLLTDAHVLTQAGASVLLLECVDAELSAEITVQCQVPTIGIGSGIACSGQILVIYDILGISPYIPSFSQNFLEKSADGSILSAIKSYKHYVKSRPLP